MSVLAPGQNELLGEPPDTVGPTVAYGVGGAVKLLAADGVDYDHFGCSVSVSGNLAIVGAYGKDYVTDDIMMSLSVGAAYVFSSTGSGWTQVAELIPDDGKDYDYFGYAVALSGTTAIIGAYGQSSSWPGSAYIFAESGSGWSQVTKLAPDQGWVDVVDWVSISGSTALVAQGQQVYVFADSGVGWSQVATLTPSEPVPHIDALAISGTTALVGSAEAGDTGAVYVFSDTGAGWTQVAKLTASDSASWDQFGCSVSLSGTMAIIGAYGDDDVNLQAGAAYIFTDTGSGWTEVAKLTAADGAAGDRLGESVSLSGSMAVVGASHDDDHGSNSGSAYMFVDAGSSWRQIVKLTAPDGAASDHLGCCVSADGTTTLIGAVGDDDRGVSSGSAYTVSGPVLSEDTGADWGDRFTSDTMPSLMVPFSEAVYGDDADLTVTGPDAQPVDPTRYTLSGWGTTWLVIDFTTPLLLEGQYAVTFNGTGTITDLAGNPLNDGADEVISFVLQTAVPASPGALDLQPGSDLGHDDADNITADATPTFDVTAGPYFRVYRDAVRISGPYESGPSWTAPAQPDGTFAYSVTAVDESGNESDPSEPITVTIDANPPAMPDALDLRSGSDLGLDDEDDVTSDTTPTFDVTAGPYFRVYRNGLLISGEHESGPTWTAPEQLEGTADYTVAAVDVAGNESEPSAPLAITIDAAGPSIASESAEVVKLLAGDGAENDCFGYGTSIDGSMAIVGACSGAQGMGVAYLYANTSSGWTQVARLYAADGATYDDFGYAVAISGTTAIVGAEGDDDKGANSGSAYVFENTGSGWTQVAKLTADDGKASAGFGWSVALSGNTAIIGAQRFGRPGSAYVFVRDAAGWNQVAKLVPDNAGEGFGRSVAISGNTAIVGTYMDDDHGTNSGSAYVFADSGSGWTQVAKLTLPDGEAGDYFGTSVSISGSMAVVGAGGDDGKGSAYVFADTGAGWTQVAKLAADDGAQDDYFGGAVSISGAMAIVGAQGDDDRGDDSGSAYLFADTGAGWIQVAKYVPADGAAGDRFGTFVSLSGTTAVIGAMGDDDQGSYSGSAYVYTWHEHHITLSEDTGADAQDRITADTTPVLSVPLSEAVYGEAADVTVTGPDAQPVDPDDYIVSGWGTSTLTVAFTTPLLLDGQYSVTFNGTSTITDLAGNALNDGQDEVIQFTLDTTAPVVTVNRLTTADTTPPLTGTVDDPTVAVDVTVDGKTYRATNHGDGTWTLADDVISPALALGTYEVEATAADAAGNTGADGTTWELAVRQAGDLSDDGFVGADDLDRVRAFWGQPVPTGDWSQGDPSGDGFCGADDLDIIRANWGQGAPPVPAIDVEETVAMPVVTNTREQEPLVAAVKGTVPFSQGENGDVRRLRKNRDRVQTSLVAERILTEMAWAYHRQQAQARQRQQRGPSRETLSDRVLAMWSR